VKKQSKRVLFMKNFILNDVVHYVQEMREVITSTIARERSNLYGDES